jgi:hypothetical protein
MLGVIMLSVVASLNYDFDSKKFLAQNLTWTNND